MNTTLFIVSLSLAASLILAVLILLHLRKSSSGYYLFWINLGLAGWVLSDYLSNIDLPYIQLLWWNRLIFTTTAVASWGFAMFSAVFPLDNKISLRTKSLLYLLLAVIVGLSLSPFLVRDIIPGENVTDVSFGQGIYIYAAFTLSCLLHTVILTTKKYFSPLYKQYRKVLDLFVLGVGIFLVFAITTNLILPIVFNFFDLTVLTPVYTTTFSFIIFWAILKHKFLDIKVIATEIFIFSLWLFLSVQYMFASSTADKLSDSVLLVMFIIFGYLLIKSVKNEVNRKEQLQEMADKLASANDQLRKLDNAKSEFISIASHQLRTPLTAIKGFLSLVLEGTYGELNNPNIAAALNKVYFSSEMLIQLVEDLLNVSRIESGRMDIKIEKANLENVIKDLYENFSLTAKDKKLYLDYKIQEGSLPEVSMDAAKMREVFSNLIDNSIKYTERGGVTIRGEVREEENGNFVRITISDTGVGIPETEIPYLFKKFSRGKDISRLHANGTGLGLYVGKNIVEAHKGKIWIESEGLGRGSKFIVELPIGA
jgi:signal transduction histidine kinase